MGRVHLGQHETIFHFCWETNNITPKPEIKEKERKKERKKERGGRKKEEEEGGKRRKEEENWREQRRQPHLARSTAVDAIIGGWRTIPLPATPKRAAVSSATQRLIVESCPGARTGGADGAGRPRLTSSWPWCAVLIRMSRAPVASLIQLCKCATLRVSSALIQRFLIMPKCKFRHKKGRGKKSQWMRLICPFSGIRSNRSCLCQLTKPIWVSLGSGFIAENEGFPWLAFGNAAWRFRAGNESGNGLKMYQKWPKSVENGRHWELNCWDLNQSVEMAEF